MGTVSKETMVKMQSMAFALHKAGNEFIDKCWAISLKSDLNSFFVVSLIENELARMKESFDKAKKEIDL